MAGNAPARPALVAGRSVFGEVERRVLEQYPVIGKDAALFLDIDGTLVGFADHPDAVEFPNSLRTLLAGLAEALGGAVALISGRSLDSVARLTAPLMLPVAGQHGAEWQTAGAVPGRLPAPSAHRAVRARMAALCAGRPDLRLEDKGLSMALHYQPTTPDVAVLAAVLSSLGGDAFELLQGRLVLELRPRGIHKGEAVARFMAEAPFRGRVPFYLGDDWTDEDGFAAVLERGGHAIRVGGFRDGTRAQAFLADPAAARQWLGESLDRLRAGAG
jgi:trehalose 6-phosphate phosphatase